MYLLGYLVKHLNDVVSSAEDTSRVNDSTEGDDMMSERSSPINHRGGARGRSGIAPTHARPRH
jgi:hypothetical protein